ncbi:MAG: cbb3-type cytochrome c oxidase subunit I [Mariprofundaceae bacterium]|nr:cbb3-type cytochrome c oxidase subunit I [Mariprofundaceae bacterium]
MSQYFLSCVNKQQRSSAVAWLYIAVGFLLASGIYPLLLALARTTYEMPWKDFFYTALVLHVDFTVLWWLLGIAAVFWTLNSAIRWPQLNKLAMALVIIGGVVVAIAPLLDAAKPLTNNYVPMLENRYFIKGLTMFGAGVFLMALLSLLSNLKTWGDQGELGALHFGITTSAVITLVAILSVLWTFLNMPADMELGRSYYETLFWAGGHVLQFTHTALLMVAWLCLASICGAKIAVSSRVLWFFFALSLCMVLLAPLAFALYELTDPKFSMWFVWLMRDGNGIAPMLVGMLVLWGLFTSNKIDKPYLKAALVFSILLFATGGALGLFVSESSTLITAHYHGSIVAVTMAFMAMTYHWLPQFGFSEPSRRLATIQVFAYALGQFLHVIGLAWGGGHGMKRKVVGTTQDIGIQSWITPQDLVGAGGVIAVLSGILFAAVVLPIMLKGRQEISQ